MKRREQITAAMLDGLDRIAAHERAGRFPSVDLLPTRTHVALGRRGLIEPVLGDGVRLTEKGWNVWKKLNAPFTGG